MKNLFIMIVAALAIANVAHASRGCRDGETARFPSNNPALQGGEGGAQDVLWTCVGGRFIENGYTAPAPTRNTCREGEAHYWPSNNPALRGSEGNAADVLWTCHNGVFTENYSMPAPRYSGCREGSHEIFMETRGDGSEGMDRVEYVCHSGRFVKVSR